MAVSKSKPRITVYRQAGSDVGSKSNGMSLYVRILDPNNGLLLREHVRQKRGWYRIQSEDHPQRTPFRVVQLLGRAGRVGTHVGTLCNSIYSQQGEVGVRRILAFSPSPKSTAPLPSMKLARPPWRWACTNISFGAALPGARCPQAPLSLRQVDPLIRELVHYRDLIHTKTKEQSE